MFPKKERALATGIFNSGTNIGALVTPLVPMITIAWGWRAAFIITGAIGFIWLVAWLLLYRRPEEHPSLSKDSELEYRAITGSGSSHSVGTATAPANVGFLDREIHDGSDLWVFFLAA